MILRFILTFIHRIWYKIFKAKQEFLIYQQTCNRWLFCTKLLISITQNLFMNKMQHLNLGRFYALIYTYVYIVRYFQNQSGCSEREQIEVTDNIDIVNRAWVITRYQAPLTLRYSLSLSLSLTLSLSLYIYIYIYINFKYYRRIPWMSNLIETI